MSAHDETALPLCPRCNDSGVVASPDGDALDCPYCDDGEADSREGWYTAMEIFDA